MSSTTSVQSINNANPLSGKKSTNPHQISLADRTTPQDRSSLSPSDAERSGSELEPSASSSKDPLVRQATGGSLRETLQQRINKQKFARYQSSRYEHDSQDLGAVNLESAPRGVLERGRKRAAEFIRRKRTIGRGEERDAVFDILYENQRGSFLFGIPRYSSNTLLQFDPKPWQNADFRTSAVDIRNAQVPDPSWQWAWKSWYVDMSRDVDEEGWEYSFAFPAQFAWHGNHPWFHSFVRRRRWLRRRVRKDTIHKTKERAHELAPDYFTIHTKILSAGSQTERSNWGHSDALEEERIEEVEVPDILTLLQYIAKARVDREKLIAMRKFVDQGGEDLHYLADRMSEIMSLFIYQSSRRQVLTELIQHQDAVTKQQQDLAAHDHQDDEKAEEAHDARTRKAESLAKAISAADAQVQKLEYWSDVKDMMQLESVDHVETKLDIRRWQGALDSDTNRFRAKQAADAPAATLHDEPEVQSKHAKDSSHDTDTDTSGYTTAPSVPDLRRAVSPSRAKSPPDDEEEGLERFVTASEGPVSSIKPKQWRDKHLRGKQRQQALQLDGVEEELDVSGPSDAANKLTEIDADAAIVPDD